MIPYSRRDPPRNPTAPSTNAAAASGFEHAWSAPAMAGARRPPPEAPPPHAPTSRAIAVLVDVRGHVLVGERERDERRRARHVSEPRDRSPASLRSDEASSSPPARGRTARGSARPSSARRTRRRARRGSSSSLSGIARASASIAAVSSGRRRARPRGRSRALGARPRARGAAAAAGGGGGGAAARRRSRWTTSRQPVLWPTSTSRGSRARPRGASNRPSSSSASRSRLENPYPP